MSEFKYDCCIICEDKNYVNKLVSDLKTQRPYLKCMYEDISGYGKFAANKLSKPMKESRKVIVIFSNNSETEETEYAAFTVIGDMIRNKQLNTSKLIPVKLTQDAVIPEEIEGFVCANALDDSFLNRLLITLDGNYLFFL
ncbi:uncharacterized protein LOC117106201 [Anneissia japonica]|uniref:uncharacterized protein LOC117106201 n=1 Tax=Anneissia japonica TaxID=1529436 RepID=UPI001425A296|nr:uncharacterized protein LOC117106201 [Anneissia japonica]